MTYKEPENWWSWAPSFPRKATIAVAILFDLVTAATITLNAATQDTSSDHILLVKVSQTFLTPAIIANFLGLLAGFQLNFEVIHMILSKKRNWTDVQEAKTTAKAEGLAEGQAKANAEAQAWFELYQADPDNAPPPPFRANGNSHSG